MQVVYDFMTNGFIIDLTTCLNIASVMAHVLNTSPEIQPIQVTLGTILMFPVRNHPPSVGHVYQNTPRYWGWTDHSVNRPTKSVRPVA
jgi:hypothetical protein